MQRGYARTLLLLVERFHRESEATNEWQKYSTAFVFVTVFSVNSSLREVGNTGGGHVSQSIARVPPMTLPRSYDSVQYTVRLKVISHNTLVTLLCLIMKNHQETQRQSLLNAIYLVFILFFKQNKRKQKSQTIYTSFSCSFPKQFYDAVIF